MKASATAVLMLARPVDAGRTAHAWLEAGFREILVIHNGDADGGLVDAPVRALRLPKGSSPGPAIMEGARLARERECQALLIATDGLGPEEGQRLLAAAGEDWPAMARGDGTTGPAASRVSAFLARLETGVTITGGGSWAGLYPVELLARPYFTASGPRCPVELAVRGSWAGLPLVTAPLSLPPSGQTGTGALALVPLHARLLLRSLIPWPHRRLREKTGQRPPLREQLNPVIFFKKLSLEHNTPAQLAAAVWSGIFIGALPIIPFGIVTILYVHHRLHLNKLAGVGASNICCAPFVPLVCIETGHFLRHGRFWYDFTPRSLLAELHLRLWEWLLGALIIGPLLGFAGALATYYAVLALRNRRAGAATTGE